MPEGPTTVGGVIREQARARGEHPLLVCDDDRLGYVDAERRSAALARGLLALGAGRGTHVGILEPNGSAFVVAMLAAARIGAVVIPFTTFATARELREQLVDADVAILLSAKGYRSHDYVARLAEVLDGDITAGERLMRPGVPQLRHVVFDVERLCRAGESIDMELLHAAEDDVVGGDSLTIVYTSGSTSAPKGAVHTHAALLTHQRNLNEIRGLTRADTLFCNSPFFWIGGLGFGLLATLVAGATLVCSNAVDAGRTLDLLEAERPTMTNGFAATIAHLAKHPSFGDRDLSSMRRGNLYPIMAPEARPADPELRHNMLGMTEAGSTLLLSGDETDQPEQRRGSFGRPAAGFDTKIVGPDSGEPVGAGEPGELCIRGPFVMQRYYRRSREECFDRDGWFHTGDMVCADVDGFLYFLGRRTAMIKTAGANVSPVEVANAIGRLTGAVAHVIGLPDAQRGEVVAAVIALADDQPFDERTLREGLARELSSFKIPRRIVAIPAAELPQLSSGKVDGRRLPGLFDA
ncbi:MULTISPECIES: class I adenylate-forming enzyme family protein [unclassified Mycobacterium]|uniref:class I adenylate-forming enzyme family protein n=1 Tax=unclassified Mycobacterium TaxID=2642494 RepID=UPI0029C6DE65|nr:MULTISPECIES: class I adenylate-forming enzyme family protein [unclassified Mycobacterium]